MKKNLIFTILVLLVPSFAIAHVSVRPRDSKPGAEERFVVGSGMLSVARPEARAADSSRTVS
jgi:hypothetical protein